MMLGCIGGHPLCDILADAASYVAVCGAIAAYVGAIVGVIVAKRKDHNQTAAAQVYAFWAFTVTSFVVGMITLGFGFAEAKPKTKP
jgi:ABC-type dipeptide/oligopeptide/nickel transport system permease component